MMLWFVLALMTLAAIFAVIWPLARPGGRLRSGSDVLVYRDQIEEIQRDRAAGLIGENEAEAAQVEVSRRLLAAADAEVETPRPGSAAAVARRRRMVATAALVAVSFGAAGLYLALGSPFLPAQLLAARNQEQSIATLIAQVETHLAGNPNDGRGWEVIAPVYLRLGRFDEAVKARRNALALSGETSDRLAGLGEALTAAANSTVTAEAKAAFERAVALDGENARARYFLGVAAEQAGRPAEAATIWRRMLAGGAADAPWADYIRHEIARVEDGPSEEQVATANNLGLDPRAMVERLAERLHRDGSDLDGWLRLMQSYKVLGERDKALAAFADARRALASEPDKVRRIEEFAKELGLGG